jgi:hypothetical protein
MGGSAQARRPPASSGRLGLPSAATGPALPLVDRRGHGPDRRPPPGRCVLVAEGSDQHDLAHVCREPFKQLTPCRLVGGLRWTLTVGPIAVRLLGLLACGHDDYDQDQGHHHGYELCPVGPAKLPTRWSGSSRR